MREDIMRVVDHVEAKLAADEINYQAGSGRVPRRFTPDMAENIKALCSVVKTLNELLDLMGRFKPTEED